MVMYKRINFKAIWNAETNKIHFKKQQNLKFISLKLKRDCLRDAIICASE